MKTSAATMETAENKAKSILPWWRKIVEGTTQATENRGGNRLSRCSHLRSRISRFAYYSLPPNYETILRGGGSRSRGKSSIKTFSSFSLFIGGHGGHGFYDLWNTLPHNNYSAIGRCCSIERFFICIFIVPRACTCVGGGGGGGEIERPTE